MGSLFKSIFHSGKTAVLNPPPDAPVSLNLAPAKSSDGTAAAPAAEPAAPPVNEAAVLQDFLIKNFLLDEPTAETATPVVPLSYARMPEPLADLSSNTDANPDANPNADTSAITKANASTETSVDASTDADPIVQITLTEPE